jgi:hypothetical protein
MFSALGGFAGRWLSGDDRIAVVLPSATICRLDRDLRGMMPMRGLMGGPCDRWRGENRKRDRTQQKSRPSFSSKCHEV